MRPRAGPSTQRTRRPLRRRPGRTHDQKQDHALSPSLLVLIQSFNVASALVILPLPNGGPDGASDNAPDSAPDGAPDGAMIVASSGAIPTAGEGIDTLSAILNGDTAGLRLDGDPVRFLVRADLRDREGAVIGHLCMIDTRPHGFGPARRALFDGIADMAAQTMGLRGIVARQRRSIAAHRLLGWTAAPDGSITDLTEPLRALIGMRSVERLQALAHPDDAESFHFLWVQALRFGTPFDTRFRLRATDGTDRQVHATASPERDDSGSILHWCGRIAPIEHATADRTASPLSPRLDFRLMLDQHLAAAGRGRGFALLRLELHDFRAMNNTFGQTVGDRLLAQVATRIGACIRETDLLAHESGNAFFVILGDVGAPEEAMLLADRMQRALTAPVAADGALVSVGAAIGITLCPADGAQADTLLQNADLALARAKAAGRGRSCFFCIEMDEHLRRRQALKTDLGDALARRQFSLDYQPMISVADGRVSGFETLLRWNHPTLGLVSPLDFVPEAESNGLIVPIGQWVLEQACRDAMAWPGNLTVAVNLSALQIHHHGLVQTVTNALRTAGLPGDRLVLEITESVPLLNDAGNVAALNALRALGVRIALDDFGTGHASLSYLHCFAFDIIKIERSFVTRMLDGGEALTILRAVIGLAKALGIVCVAEGVETRVQHDALSDEGCDGLQGFFYARPIDTADIPDLLCVLAERQTAEHWSHSRRQLA